MVIQTVFSVDISTVKYLLNDEGKETGEKIDETRQLQLNEDNCESFMFRWRDNFFTTPDGIDCEIIADHNGYKTIVLREENSYSVVTNPLQIIYEIVEGYRKIVFMDKVASIAAIDFDVLADAISASEEQ